MAVPTNSIFWSVKKVFYGLTFKTQVPEGLEVGSEWPEGSVGAGKKKKKKNQETWGAWLGAFEYFLKRRTQNSGGGSARGTRWSQKRLLNFAAPKPSARWKFVRQTTQHKNVDVSFQEIFSRVLFDGGRESSERKIAPISSISRLRGLFMGSFPQTPGCPGTN